MLISILLLSFGFEATNYDQSHVDSYRTILCYQLHLNRAKEKMNTLKKEKEDSDNVEILDIHVVSKEMFTPDNEVLAHDEKIVIKIEPKDEKVPFNN